MYCVSPYGLRFAVAVTLLLALGCARALFAGTFESLGPQLTSRTFQATTFSKHPDGRDLLCTVMRSQPTAKLLIIDAITGQVRHTFPLRDAVGAWAATTASDGSVYIGTEPHGKLFRFIPGEDRVHDLGVALAGETHIWDLSAGADGEIFGGTYPHCRVFRYTPENGYDEPHPGRIVPGETYARSVAVDPVSRTLYIGAGVKTPHLIELDLATHTRREWPLPRRFAREQSVYQLFIAGDLLFAMVYPMQRTLVFDRRTRTLVAELETTGNYDFVSPPSPHDGRIYFLHANTLKVFNPNASADPPRDVAPARSSLAMAWLTSPGAASGPALVVFTHEGQLLRHHPITGQLEQLDTNVAEEPTIIHSLATATDGRLWMSGYLFGGAAAFDPRTGGTRQYKGISQAEAIAALGSTLYFGLYPRARIQEYDTAQPWIERGANPQQFAILEKQSRPMAMLAAPELGKLFIGTIPEYGLLGGMLAVWDVRKRTLDTFPDVVPRQSIASLAYSAGLILGGTTVQGGLGVERTEKEARLFLWDPAANQKTFETVPVAGAGIVSGLTPMADGTVWGFAQGTFFVFDLTTRRVTHTAPVLTSDFTGRAMWQDANLVVHPGGDVFAIQHDRFLRIDGRTKEITILRTGIKNKHARPIAMDATGRVYFADGVDLWRYTP